MLTYSKYFKKKIIQQYSELKNYFDILKLLLVYQIEQKITIVLYYNFTKK
jgi:hypothetical protein